jgi:hypothetical protein
MGMLMSGFTPGWAIVAIAVLALLGVIVRQFVPYRKQAQDAEAKLRDDLIRRVERLERQIDRERTKHEAERALGRHELKNINQCFDALLLLIEMAPERAAESVAKIKEMRARQVEAEAKEKAIIRAAEIAAEVELEAEAKVKVVAS